MKRTGLLLAAAGVLSLAGWVMYGTGCSADSDAEAPPTRPRHTRGVDPLSTSAGWSYRQNQPRHWRYVVLEHK
jgi:hypothetical protein